MTKKLKSRAGLTLTEMLITLLLLSLFSAACLAGVTVAFQVRRDNIKANDADVLASMVTQLITDELRLSDNISGGGSEITYRSYASGYESVTMQLLDKDDSGKKKLYMTVNTDQPMLNSAAYTNQLRLENLNFTLNGDTVEVSFDVSDENNNAIVSKTFTVKRLNAVSESEPAPDAP